MKKIFDNMFCTSFDLKHVHREKTTYYKKNKKKWICIEPTKDLEFQYATLLDKKKKILLLGDWRTNAVWFRFLKSRDYKVYLEKKKDNRRF